jgi:hypothetical protein
MIREILAIGLIVAGLALLSWVLAAPDRLLPGLPMAAGELAIGVWLFFLQPEGGERG